MKFTPNPHMLKVVCIASLVSVFLMLGINAIIFGRLYIHNPLLTFSIYAGAFILTILSFWLYAQRRIQMLGHLAFKVLIIIIVELGLSMNSYQNIMNNQNTTSERSKIKNEIALLDTELVATIKSHNNRIHDIQQNLNHIVLNACQEWQQDRELSKLAGLNLLTIDINDPPSSIHDINISNLGLVCSKGAVQTKIDDLNQFKKSVINLKTQKNTLTLQESNIQNQNSQSHSQSLRLFIKDYGLEIILSAVFLFFIQHLLLNPAIKKIRYQSSKDDPAFSRDELLSLLLTPNKQYDIRIAQEYQKTHFLLKPFKSKPLSSSDYLRNKLFLKINQKDHQHLMNLLHCSIYDFSNKCRIAKDEEILQLVEFGILDENELPEVAIYKFDQRFFGHYLSFNTRLKGR